MPDTEFLTFLRTILFQHLGKNISILSYQPLTGGCINEAVKIETEAGNFFLKYNQPDFEVQFQQEATSLKILHESNSIQVPEVRQTGTHNNRAYLLMEYIQPAVVDNNFWQGFGENLASLHRTTSDNQQFGLPFDNYIGALPQKNNFHINWIEFFIENRLEVQIAKALDDKLISPDFLKRFQQLYDLLPELLAAEPPSLIHGDLWSGNFLCGSNGQVVLIDPAIYFGNREIEISFTRLFGGFSSAFYESYHGSWPMQPGYEDRFEIYNLYPLLVHVNLFGSSYLSGVEAVINKYA